MNKHPNTLTEAMLAAHFSGKTTPEEQAAIDQWRLMSPQNEAVFKEYELIWKHTGNFEKRIQFDAEVAYARILRKIEPVSPSLTVRRPTYYLTRVAAVAVLLIGSILLFRAMETGTKWDQMAVATGENQEFRLADGTVVWLRNGSTLSFQSTIDVHPTRTVSLKGEGFFDVSHDPDRPFRVELDGGGHVEVLGTEFSISQTGGKVAVLVKSGKVRFSPVKGNFPVLTASQKAVYDKENARMVVTEAVSMNELSWHTGGLEFISTPLSRVMEDLEQYYGVKIRLENSSLSGCLHTAPLTNSPLEEVLKTLELAYGLHISKLSDNEYTLSGGYCSR